MDLSAQESVRVALLAEKYGFDSVWVSDHMIEMSPGSMVDCWTTIAAIGSQTKTISMFPAVTDAYRIHPAKTAQIVATLYELTNGRAGLGIGAGEAMNLVPFGMEWEESNTRIERLKEAVEVIKLLFTSANGKKVNYSGKRFNLKDAWLDQAEAISKRPAPQIYVGAIGSSKLLDLTGRLGDGWIPWLNTPETYSKRCEIVKEGARQAGRDFQKIDTAAWLYMILSTDSDKLKDATRRMKGLLVAERNTLKSMGYDLPLTTKFAFTHIQPSFVTSDYMKKVEELKKDIPDDLAGKFLAAGSPEECIETISRYVRAGAKHITIRSLSPNTEEFLREFNRSVLPYFKK